MSWQIDQRIGRDREWPTHVTVLRGGELRVYAPRGFAAKRVRVTVDERGCVGHDSCSACGRTVGMDDSFCANCGARLEG